MIGVKGFQPAELNPMWAGDDVSYQALHEWIRNHKDKPVTCEMCNLEKDLDLANISQEYKRDVADWEWLCRKCHMEKDGRLKILNKNGLTSMSGKEHTDDSKRLMSEKSLNRTRNEKGHFVKTDKVILK